MLSLYHFNKPHSIYVPQNRKIPSIQRMFATIEAIVRSPCTVSQGYKTTDSRIILCDARRKAITESPHYGILHKRSDFVNDFLRKRQADKRKPGGGAATSLQFRIYVFSTNLIMLAIYFKSAKFFTD